MLDFEERGKPEYLEKTLSEQRREPTTNSAHILRRVWKLIPSHIGGRRVLSPLQQPCIPIIIIICESDGKQMSLDCLLWASTMHSNKWSIISRTLIILPLGHIYHLLIGKTEVLKWKLGRQLNVSWDPGQNRSPWDSERLQNKQSLQVFCIQRITLETITTWLTLLDTLSKRKRSTDISHLTCSFTYIEYSILHCPKKKKRNRKKKGRTMSNNWNFKANRFLSPSFQTTG